MTKYIILLNIIKNIIFYFCGIILLFPFILFITGSSVMMIVNMILELFLGRIITYFYEMIINNENIQSMYINKNNSHFFPRSIIYGSIAIINFIGAILYWCIRGYDNYFIYYLVLYYLIEPFTFLI